MQVLNSASNATPEHGDYVSLISHAPIYGTSQNKVPVPYSENSRSTTVT